MHNKRRRIRILDELKGGLEPLRKRLDQSTLDGLVVEIESGLDALDFFPDDDKIGEQALREQMIRCLLQVLSEGRVLLSKQQARKENFEKLLTRTLTKNERRELILGYARDLGSSKAKRRADRRAFRRWFGADAVIGRALRLRGESEHRLAFVMERVGAVAARLVHGWELSDVSERWLDLAVESSLGRWLAYAGDSRVRVAAFRGLTMALGQLPPEVVTTITDHDTLTSVYRSALDRSEPIEVQVEALALLGAISPESLAAVLQRRFADPGSGDDMFVRAAGARLLNRHSRTAPELIALLPAAAADHSDFVRQALAMTVADLPSAAALHWLRHLAADSSPQVQAAALLQVPRMLGKIATAELAELVVDVFDDRGEVFAQRVAVHVCGLIGCAADHIDEASARTLETALDGVHGSNSSLIVRREAARAKERIWCAHDQRAVYLYQVLKKALEGLPEGRSRRLPRQLLKDADPLLIGRVMSVLAQDDFGLDLERGWFADRLTRGQRFKARTWRILHELRHPSPDKRQAFRHTVGRVSYGRVRAPSAILAELSETKVPGEPLMIAEEGDWRPYLPLVDDLLSTLNQVVGVQPVHIVTSEGITEIRPPSSIVRRLRAYARITWSFARFAKLRNWQRKSQLAQSTYVEEISDLGFSVSFQPHPLGGDHQAPAPDFSVSGFFSSFSLLPLNFGTQFRDYFFSLYENTLSELALFTAAATGLFLGYHLWTNFSLRRARNMIPLVIGGWGTRGKSGTERLKAALFSSLGYNVVSKSTGCEAMFMHGYSFGRLREMPLFRSYDKATIWEQRNVVRIASGLDADVLLWECMGLTPNYVQVLQRDWMHDDVSTITNTYPDHEDLQGPAGFNIPQVMTRFIPRRAVLHTSEEQMRPILAEAAADLKTGFQTVGWIEAGMLTTDVLDRFPYEEHPSNIALVLSMSGEMGIDRDYALRVMADEVVPDLGVLKTFAPAPMAGRVLEFSNGMSANERHGCLSNWRRLGFDRHDPDLEPGTWLTTVVNNRADRVPRSRVFASVLVNDLDADCHVLIGGNLSGLLGYIKEAWQGMISELTLWPAAAQKEAQHPLDILEAHARRLRIPVNSEQIRQRLGVMLASCTIRSAERSADQILGLEQHWQDIEAVAAGLSASGVADELAEATINRLRSMLGAFAEYKDLVARVQADRETPEELNQALHEHSWQWFERKFVVIWDYHASGDTIVNRICQETPPGFRNRIMGIQNIKGTGLDFVYRWQAWSACHSACAQLLRDDVTAMAAGAEVLATFQEFGPLCEDTVRNAVSEARSKPAAQRESIQARLEVALSNLDAKVTAFRADLSDAKSHKQGSWAERLTRLVESFLDLGDAIRRRRTADAIYRDIQSQRIGPERAVAELLALSKRQQGGWFLKPEARL